MFKTIKAKFRKIVAVLRHEDAVVFSGKAVLSSLSYFYPSVTGWDGGPLTCSYCGVSASLDEPDNVLHTDYCNWVRLNKISEGIVKCL